MFELGKLGLRWVKVRAAGVLMGAVIGSGMGAGFAAEGQEAVGRDPVMAAPAEPGQWEAWREGLASWRREAKQRLGYDDRLYRRADFAWGASCYNCCLLMMYDREFYDPAGGKYLVEQWVEKGRRQFGGYDAVVLWQAYPRIGFDERNQFDFYRDMPGGLAGLREVSERFHQQGVKVFIDYNPWDTGTRREGQSDLDSLADIVKALEADGIFLDTLKEGSGQWRAKLDGIREGVVLESELALPPERVCDHHMSWAQWFSDSDAPGVLRNKWLERRHMMHQIQRWNRDHTGELQMAWMNGSGIMVWENVFGSWVGWSERDKSLLRSMLGIQRRYAGEFSGESWTPLVQTEQEGVFASLWEGQAVRLWTLVNRREQAVRGLLLRVGHVEGAQYYDLIQGQEAGKVEDGEAVLEGELAARGLGAFLSGKKEALGEDLKNFLKRQGELWARRSEDTTFSALKVRLKMPERTKRYKRVEVPAGMAVIPGAKFDMEVEYKMRECGFYDGFRPVSLTYPALHQTMRLEQKQVHLSAYAMDVAPVTNGQFAEFLESSGYQPRHGENFLKHWVDGRWPMGKKEHPVVYVDLEDARAYAAWAGKRLPTEEEWQWAAQGPKGLRYPWGNEWREGVCNDGSGGGTTSVRAFGQGRSPFGCYDMCGNVWEWTESEREDGRTRFCMLRGGSFYQARGSDWYAEGGGQPTRHAAKFLLMWPGLDRCTTIGFRCVVDMSEEQE